MNFLKKEFFKIKIYILLPTKIPVHKHKTEKLPINVVLSKRSIEACVVHDIIKSENELESVLAIVYTISGNIGARYFKYTKIDKLAVKI